MDARYTHTEDGRYARIGKWDADGASWESVVVRGASTHPRHSIANHSLWGFGVGQDMDWT